MTDTRPGSAEANEPAAHDVWPAPFMGASARIDARIEVPGSKSLTNRHLVLAALAQDPSILRAPLRSRDSALMIAGLRALGAQIEELPGGGSDPDLRIVPIPAAPAGSSGSSQPSREIGCGLAGTVMRFLPAVAALGCADVRFDGDSYAARRPMGAVIEGLRGLGAQIDDDARGTLPLTVRGRGLLPGGEVRIDSSASSQFLSGLLLAGASMQQGITVHHVSPEGRGVPSLPHVEMTVACLRAAGVQVEHPDARSWRVLPGPIRVPEEIVVEPDLSNAGPFLAAATVTGSRVSIPRWPVSTTQGGAHWEQILPAFGARVDRTGDELVVTGGPRVHGVDLDLGAAGELAPTVAAICALAEGESVLRGIAHLRGHETDRLAALREEITRLGGDCQETADGLRIRPRPLHGGTWRTYEDHRMATAGAIIGLRVEGVEVENIATTAKTLPDFPALWAAMLTGGGVA